MTVGLHDRLLEKLPKTQMVATSGLVEQLRLTKDNEEIERLRRRCGRRRGRLPCCDRRCGRK